MSAAVRLTPQTIRLGSADSSLVGDQIALGGVPRGAVVLLRGSQTQDTVAVQNDLAEHGYESVALPWVNVDLIGEGAREIELVAAGLDRLGDRGWRHDQTAVVGYGAGAWAALHAASRYELGAAVSVSPPHAVDRSVVEQVISVVSAVRAPWLGLFAGITVAVTELDDAILGIRNDLVYGGTYARAVAYPGVHADFYERDSDTCSHAAAFDAAQRVTEWLNKRVVPRPTPLGLKWLERRGGEGAVSEKGAMGCPSTSMTTGRCPGSG